MKKNENEKNGRLEIAFLLINKITKMLFIIKYNFFFGSLVVNLNKSSSYKRTIINYFC